MQLRFVLCKVSSRPAGQSDGLGHQPCCQQRACFSHKPAFDINYHKYWMAMISKSAHAKWSQMHSSIPCRVSTYQRLLCDKINDQLGVSDQPYSGALQQPEYTHAEDIHPEAMTCSTMHPKQPGDEGHSQNLKRSCIMPLLSSASCVPLALIATAMLCLIGVYMHPYGIKHGGLLQSRMDPQGKFVTPYLQPPTQQQRLQPSIMQASGVLNTYVPRHLDYMLVCITFQWNVLKLIFLEEVLRTAASYPTNVDILIVTDNALSTARAVHMMHLPVNITYYEAKAPTRPDHRHWLTWVHKHAIKQAFEQENYTTVLYMEDDQRVTWPVLVSWALDTEVLSNTSFTRCIYRTEVGITGNRHMLDFRTAVSLSSVRTIDVTTDLATQTTYKTLVTTAQSKTCYNIYSRTKQCSDSVHKYFFSPKEPFQGMFIATRQQLQKYVRHPYWSKHSALAAKDVPSWWGYPERSNSLMVMLHVPAGCDSNCMVPYSKVPGKNGAIAYELSPLARVEHLRNGYSAVKKQLLGKLPENNALGP